MELWHVLFWAGLSIALIATEIATVQFVSIWFAAGSLVSFITSFFIKNFYIEAVIFVLVSIILLFATRPLVKKFTSSTKERTNADSLIGQKCIVKETVNNINSTGRVFVNGLDWAARSITDNIIFYEGDTGLIEEIKGVTLIIKKLD